MKKMSVFVCILPAAAAEYVTCFANHSEMYRIFSIRIPCSSCNYTFL